jgi:DNA-binding MarR family transcriptional regulator
MENKRLVKRVKDPSDRRVVGIKILARGRKLLAETENPTTEYAKRILTVFSDKELKEATTLMNKMLKVIEDETYLKDKNPAIHNITIEQRIELQNKLS